MEPFGRRAPRVADGVAPVVTAVELVSGRILAGSPTTVRAHAQDNHGVASFNFRTAGAVTSEGIRPVTPPSPSASADYEFTVPAGTPAGSTVSVTAQAVDTSGIVSAEVTRDFTVDDGTRPVVRIASPANGAPVHAGDTIEVLAWTHVAELPAGTLQLRQTLLWSFGAREAGAAVELCTP